MYDFITVHDFLDQFFSLFVIHRVNLTNSPIISLLKPLVLCLQFFEVVRESFVFFRQRDIVPLVPSLFFLEPFFNGTD